MLEPTTSFSLQNNVALITGAAGHLGSEMAKGLAKHGAIVYLNGRNADRLRQLEATIREDGGAAHALPFDVRDWESSAKAIQEIRKTTGRLDILINNAYEGSSGTLSTAEKENFQDSYEIIVSAAAGLAKEARSLMIESAQKRFGGSSIINIASMYGQVSPDLRIYERPEEANPPYYGAAKAGLIQLTRYLACELGPLGIRVNALAPGPFPTDGIAAEDPDFVRRLADRVPSKRIGKASEVAGPAVFLASDAASFVNGSVIDVNGGWTSW